VPVFLFHVNSKPVFTVFRIRIQLDLWIKEISCFEVMDVLFGGLEASTVARKPFIEVSE
jgi:hypothetical protein